MSLLEIRNLDAFYGDFQALFGLDFDLDEHETVAAIGANGAGKTTLLRAITGMVEATSDALDYRGDSIQSREAADIVALGIAMVPEGRRLFPSLSVEENLVIGGYSGRPGGWSLDRVYELFPALRNRRSVPGTALSGGEQQMTAIGRALMSNPELILFDELSLGLAPVVVGEIYEVLPAIKAEGTAMVVVEQDINRALEVADRVYCLQEGRLALTGAPASLTRDRIAAAYFGT
ncbi:MAG: ABC transporter ATP-binding protein [Defluviicoccus sp.]|nr:ABC transporter ATP-binding protein [Defluviicoccus sp.]